VCCWWFPASRALPYEVLLVVCWCCWWFALPYEVLLVACWCCWWFALLYEVLLVVSCFPCTSL
jgi:hypothetical protein